MKKISAKSQIKRGNTCIPGEDNIHVGNEGGSDHNVETSPPIHLGNVGVKLENEGRVEGPAGLLETVEEVVEAPWEEIAGPDLSQAYVVDLTQQFNRIFVQTSFNSFKEFEKLFNKFKAETGSVFRIKSSCSVAYENSRRKRNFIPSRFKFVTVRYCCVHYGHPKMAGQGIRTKQRYLPCGCEAMLSVSYNCGALVISQANMRHNHDVSCEMAPFYAINRRITNAELKEVADVVEVMTNSRALQHFLRVQFRRATTLQDAKNVRTRVKAMKTTQSDTTKSPGSDEEEEEEEEPDEDIIMDSTAQDVHFRKKEEVVRKIDRSECDYWGEATIPKTAKRQEYQQQYQEGEMIAEVEREEQEPELEPDMRREVLGEIRTRLFSVMENCNPRVFKERVSVIEKLIEGWENNNPVHVQYLEKSNFKARTIENAHCINTSLERIENKNDRNANSFTSFDSLNVALPVMEMKGESQFFPIQVNKKLAIVEHKSQPRVINMMEITNENSPITNNKTRNIQCSMERENCKNGERRPVVLSIVKGFVGGCDQALEVEIEVDGEVAKVKAVKREPLDYYEVNVGD
ncbi:uncharacterized protein LOC135090878 isoform X1 [Scylla paramamosain]|uniref:uncharacterized protein LOC135090878 isoform X1 n=1 Tax=Scylla paramamosain TaxID=85552 RepID=UPI00308365D0